METGETIFLSSKEAFLRTLEKESVSVFIEPRGDPVTPSNSWGFVTEQHCKQSAVQRVGKNCYMGYRRLWEVKEGEEMRLSCFLGSAFSQTEPKI